MAEPGAGDAAGAPPPRVGAWVPVLVEQMVNDTLVVTLSCGERRYTGVLLDCSKRSGLFCLPSSFPKHEDPPAGACANGAAEGEGGTQGELEPWPSGPQPSGHQPAGHQPSSQLPTDHQPSGPPPSGPPAAEGGAEEPLPPLLPAPGSAPPFPPYFEGAPFPRPLWLRHTYQQWVPQPPPRGLKRTRRRLSRNRDPGRLILSTIRLRPRRVLCEKCKNTLSPEDAGAPRQSAKGRRRLSVQDKEQKKQHGDADCAEKRNKREKREEEKFSGELVHRTPVIKISYSTPQGKGEVVKIPSRVHGSVKPFCPEPVLQNGAGDQEESGDSERCRQTKCLMDKSAGSQLASIPKLKLTRPVHSSVDVPPPKIRLKPHRINDGQSVSIYKAELIDEINVLQNSREPTPGAFYSDEPPDRSLAEMSSGSSGEDDDFKRFPQGKDGHDNLAFLMNYRKRKADSSSLSVCSNDSLDESKSSSSEVTSPELCDFLPGDDASVSSFSKDERKMVPPLTVRLHTQSVSRCVTEDGRTVSVGDIVWGKIHGFPWWPARVLDINLSQKENGEPSWREAKVSWFGSPTTSFLSVSKLSPFSEFFKVRFNRKKKGMYRKAITEAARAVEHLTPEIRDLLTQFET